MCRCKGLGSWKSFLSCVPHLSGTSILSSHPEFPFLRAHHREWLQRSDCHIAGILLLPQFPLGPHWTAALADNRDTLVYWYGRKQSISQALSPARNLTNIWETFHDHCLSHGTGRLIPDQVKVLKLSRFQLNFELMESHLGNDIQWPFDHRKQGLGPSWEWGLGMWGQGNSKPLCLISM